MNGKVYFKDGHEEDVLIYNIFGRVGFITKSGVYFYNQGKFYKKVLVSVELTYCGCAEPVFEYFVVDDIDRIEIPK